MELIHPLPENKEEKDKKKTRKNVLEIIEEISYIIDYEFHDRISIFGGSILDRETNSLNFVDEIAYAAHKRQKLLKNRELENIGGTVKDYNTFNSDIWDNNVEWSNNNPDAGEITNIGEFIFALFQSDLGVNIYTKDDMDEYKIKWNEREHYWYIRPTCDYLLYKSGQLEVHSKTGINETIFVIDKDTPENYIAMASRIYELYTRYTNNKVLMRVNVIWSGTAKSKHGLRYLKNKLNSL